MEQLIIVLLLIIIFVLLCTCGRKTITYNKKEDIQTLLRQSARWAVAAEQDLNPFIKNLHGNYGAGYLFALQEIATDEEIKLATGIDIHQFKKEITRIQDNGLRSLAKICPEGQPKTRFLAIISGQNDL